jgi:hypothetical protein
MRITLSSHMYRLSTHDHIFPTWKTQRDQCKNNLAHHPRPAAGWGHHGGRGRGMRRVRGRGGMLSRRSLSVGRPGGLGLWGDGGSGNAGASGNGHGSDSAVTRSACMPFFEAPSRGRRHVEGRARSAVCGGAGATAAALLQPHGNMRSSAIARGHVTAHTHPCDTTGSQH